MWEKEKHWVVKDDNYPLTIRMIKSCSKNIWLRIYEDPYQGSSMVRIKGCSRCDGDGLVEMYESRGGHGDCPDCAGMGFPAINEISE
jgi:hypothetical protein